MVRLDKVIAFESVTTVPHHPDVKSVVVFENGHCSYVKETVGEIMEMCKKTLCD